MITDEIVEFIYEFFHRTITLCCTLDEETIGKRCVDAVYYTLIWEP